MLANITIRNFRSLKEVTFPIRDGLNVIVGSNGSGKTNILHALKFLSNIVTSGASLAMGKAGGPARNFRRGQKEINFRVNMPVDLSLYKNRQAYFVFVWDLSLTQTDSDGLIQIRHESFKIQAEVAGSFEDVFSAEIVRTPSASVRTKFWMADENFLTKRLFESSLWVSSSSRKSEIFKTLRNQIAETLRQAKKIPQDASLLDRMSRIHYAVRNLSRDLTSLDEYNIQPDVARQAVDPLPVIRMGNDGAGVSEVVGALESDQFRRLLGGFGHFRNSAYFDGYGYYDYPLQRIRKNPLADILEHLKAGVTSIDSIATEIDPSTGKRFVTFRSGNHKFRPQEVSDGTFKWLCLLIALYVPTSRVILLEEPENFMHPWMQHRFVSLIREQTKKSGGSVILSTHSVTVLNALQVNELRVVHQQSGETFLDEVSDVDGIQRVLESSSFGLGDIWVSGGIGGVTGGI